MTSQSVPSLLITLLDRLQEQESLDLEFKSGKGGLPNDLWPTVSAFGNTRGGWIVVGVDANVSPPNIDGVNKAEHHAQRLQDLLRNPQKINRSLCGAGDVSVETLDNQQLLVIRVPAASRNERPVFINGNPYTGTYVRRRSGDYRCTKEEVDRMIREAADVGADSSLLPYFGLDDLDPEAIARYRRRYQTRDPGSPWNGYDDRRFLQSIGAFSRDRENDREGITVAGLLMLGADGAIRDWRKRHVIDYRLQMGDPESDTRWDDRVVWEGNLLGAFELIYPRLTASLPAPFRLSGPTRIDESPLHEALREALVNLFVHADYAERDVSLIIQSRDGYRFRNPGSSRIPESDLLSASDRSDPRNPVLVRMFRLIGLADEAGTGMPKILRAWRQLGYQAPSIDTETERYEFTLHLRYAHLLSEEDRGWLQSLGDSWSEAEQLALVHARHEGYVDNYRLRQIIRQHAADVTKVLGSLRDRGFLQISGVGRGARYQLGPAALPLPLAAPPELAPERPELLPKHPEFAPERPELLPKSSDSTHQGEQIQQRIESIAAQIRGRRYADATARDDVVVALCAVTPLSLRELAGLLGRSQEYMRKAIGPLIASGRLRYRYPGQPNHPRQQYVARTTGEGEESSAQE